MSSDHITVTLDDISLFAKHFEGTPYHSSCLLYAHLLSDAEGVSVTVVNHAGEVHSEVDRRVQNRIYAGIRRIEATPKRRGAIR